MKRFVVVGHKAVTSGDFKLDDLSGSTGRLDILLRCVNSSFFLSHSIRRDVEVFLILQGPPNPPKTIKMVGSELRYLNPDERSTAALIRNALLKKNHSRSSPGVYVSSQSYSSVIDDLSQRSQLVYLKEEGKDIHHVPLGEDVTFVLGDNQDLNEEEEDLLTEKGAGRVRVGPKSYHSDHCIIIALNEIDRREGPSVDS